MGYTTDFEGKFKFNKKLDDDIYKLLVGLATTRRMKRNVKGYGDEGEFYIEGSGFMGQDRDENIINFNCPPKNQPSLWLQWIPTQDRKFLEWDGGEKFYSYVEWLEYLIDKILIPKGYKLSGEVSFCGEDKDDKGTISIKNNKITITYE